MVPVAIAGNISGEATTPSGNIFNEAMRGSHPHFGNLAPNEFHVLLLREPAAIVTKKFVSVGVASSTEDAQPTISDLSIVPPTCAVKGDNTALRTMAIEICRQFRKPRQALEVFEMRCSLKVGCA
jgi:hypothetical protein